MLEAFFYTVRANPGDNDRAYAARDSRENDAKTYGRHQRPAVSDVCFLVKRAFSSCHVHVKRLPRPQQKFTCLGVRTHCEACVPLQSARTEFI